MPFPNLIVGGDGGQTLQGTSGADLIYGFDPNGAAAQASSIQAARVASGLDQPLFATAVPGDQNRLFVVEKTGHIEIVDISNQDAGVFSVKPTPFLDVAGQINTAGEGGLLGLAFDSDYIHNGFFYVDLINTAGDTEIRRYQVSNNPDVADAASASLVIRIDQPDGVTNHKAGWLAFGLDGYLYAALGDGGGGGDPFHSGQNIDSLLGKMLRLDVHGDGFPDDPTRNYAIPADNPFVGKPGADETLPTACAIPGATASTARPDNSSSPTSGKANGKRSISARPEPITAGTCSKARKRSRPEHRPPG
jgi:glucose/arabinose dehydrogenase